MLLGRNPSVSKAEGRGVVTPMTESAENEDVTVTSYEAAGRVGGCWHAEHVLSNCRPVAAKESSYHILVLLKQSGMHLSRIIFEYISKFLLLKDLWSEEERIMYMLVTSFRASWYLSRCIFSISEEIKLNNKLSKPKECSSK